MDWMGYGGQARGGGSVTPSILARVTVHGEVDDWSGPHAFWRLWGRVLPASSGSQGLQVSLAGDRTAPVPASIFTWCLLCACVSCPVS